MKCPNCGEELRQIMTPKGVEIDFCGKCRGVWLDKGEIFHFTRNPKSVAKKLDTALRYQSPGQKVSPRAGVVMNEIKYPGGPTLDYCPKSGGLWFDSSEVEALLQAEREIEKDFLERPHTEAVAAPSAAAGSARRPSLSPALTALPNLVSRTVFTLFGLYALLTAVAIVAVEFLDFPIELAVLIGIAVALLQFLAGPFIMDLSLRWLYSMEWVSSDQLPEHLQVFVKRVCSRERMKVPRFGIIRDGAPQAFTYGHTPNNARLVLSSGMFDLLTKEELESVVAHELGHASHWDMVLMTVAQLAPLLLYYIYRLLTTVDSKSKKGNALGMVALGAFVLYIISEYVVLWFSRTREYYADRFAGKITGDPGYLSSALVKIAYGLAAARTETASEEKGKEKNKSRAVNLSAVGALGIFDSKAALNLAVTSYGASSGEIGKEGVKAAMRWDIWNPWAKWYELNSTHPLVANRLRYLSDQAASQGKEPYIVFDEKQPESYWDEFFADFIVHVLPYVSGAVLIIGHYLTKLGFLDADPRLLYGGGLLALGLSLLLKMVYSYRGNFFAPMNISSLLSRVKVSSTRPVPCTLNGTIVGRGVPGYIFSEDFVLKDDTGIIFLDYRHPLGIWEKIFGLLKAGEYQGKSVVVEGWYRRSPVPYIEIRRLICDGKTRRSWVPLFYTLTAIGLILAGAFFILQ